MGADANTLEQTWELLLEWNRNDDINLIRRSVVLAVKTEKSQNYVKRGTVIHVYETEI